MVGLIMRTLWEFRSHLLSLFANWKVLFLAPSDKRSILLSLHGLSLLAEDSQLPPNPDVAKYLNKCLEPCWFMVRRPESLVHNTVISGDQPKLTREMRRVLATALSRQVYATLWGVELHTGLRISLRPSEFEVEEGVRYRYFAGSDHGRCPVTYLIWLCTDVTLLSREDLVETLDFLQNLQDERSVFLEKNRTPCILLLQMIAYQCMENQDLHPSNRAIMMSETFTRWQDDGIFTGVHSIANQHLRALQCVRANRVDEALKLCEETSSFLHGLCVSMMTEDWTGAMLVSISLVYKWLEHASKEQYTPMMAMFAHCTTISEPPSGPEIIVHMDRVSLPVFIYRLAELLIALSPRADPTRIRYARLVVWKMRSEATINTGESMSLHLAILEVTLGNIAFAVQNYDEAQQWYDGSLPIPDQCSSEDRCGTLPQETGPNLELCRERFLVAQEKSSSNARNDTALEVEKSSGPVKRAWPFDEEESHLCRDRCGFSTTLRKAKRPSEKLDEIEMRSEANKWFGENGEASEPDPWWMLNV